VQVDNTVIVAVNDFLKIIEFFNISNSVWAT